MVGPRSVPSTVTAGTGAEAASFEVLAVSSRWWLDGLELAAGQNGLRIEAASDALRGACAQRGWCSSSIEQAMSATGADLLAPSQALSKSPPGLRERHQGAEVEV